MTIQKITYGDKEHALSPEDAVLFLERKLQKPHYLYGYGETQSEETQYLDHAMVSYGNKYADIKRADFMHSDLVSDADIDAVYTESERSLFISGTLREHLLATEAVARLQGVDERFESITAEALACMNQDYFKHLIDASHSQDTQAPEVVSQGIEACEGHNGKVFTMTELLESAQYIVDDYDAFIEHAMNVREPDLSVHHLESMTAIDVNVLPDVDVSEFVKQDCPFTIGDTVWQEHEGAASRYVVTDIKYSEYWRPVSANVREFGGDNKQNVPFAQLYGTKEECEETIAQKEALAFGEAVEQLSLDLGEEREL